MADPAVQLGLFCRGCRYDLRGQGKEAGATEHCCPECGRGFDPHDQRTTLPVPQRV